MRVIDDIALRYKVHWTEIDGKLRAVVLYEDIKNAPTIEAEPVRHGRWECEFETYGKLRCSVCKKEALLETANDALYATSNYCPNCGAKMDLEV